MALRMQRWNGAAYVEVDIAGSYFHGFRLSISYAHPATLSWNVVASQHTFPLAVGTFIRFWDTAGTLPDGNPQSATAPLFEGHVQMPIPAASNLIQYVAYDPTHRAQTEANVMSVAWTAGPTEGAGAYPRLVFNADNIQTDDDYALSRADRQTTAQMMQTIFADQLIPLRAIFAAPAASDAYVSGDMAQFDTEPQEKQVFESENVYSAISRLLTQFEPAYRLIWRAGDRQWRFVGLANASSETLTLNDHDASIVPLTFDVVPSMEGRYTSVKFYGPELTPPVQIQTSDGSLTVLSNVVLEMLGSVQVLGPTKFQVTDATKRRMARALPVALTIPVGGYYFVVVKTPVLQATWDGDNWITLEGVAFDFQNGIADLQGTTPYIYTSAGVLRPTGIQHYLPPFDVRMIYAYFDVPISTRWPNSGYSGTAYTIGNRENTMLLYDEMLASGYTWFGTPYTTTVRLGKFYRLAEKIHEERKDIVYTGGTTLDGLKYQFAWLNKKLNFTSLDQDGGSLTTGWESIGAWLTDVEFDFEENLTVLVMSSDKMELMGVDVDAWKRRNKIKALEMRVTTQFVSMPLYNGTLSSTLGGAVLPSGWLFSSSQQRNLVDPDTGEVVEPLD